MKYDVLVAGAGFSGAVAARILAERGKKVIIIEKHRHIAGHCYDYRDNNGITVHKYGPHIFHTKNKKVWDFVNKFSEFNFYQHKVLSYCEGKLFPFPINLDTINQVYGKNIDISEIKNFLENETEKAYFKNPPGNFRDAVVSQVGEKFYDMFFKNYTIKQWGRNPEELSAELAKRIPVRENRDDRYFSDKYQGIPKNGYTNLTENIIDHDNISVMLGTDYFDIKDYFKPELTVYTGELDRFFNYKYGKLEYRSLELVLKTYDKEFYQPVATVNYPNDYDWTRITEYKHFLNEKSDKTTVCFEYPKKDGEPYYIVPDNDNMRKRDMYIKETEKDNNYVFIGRLAEYKYYNMDQVIERVFEKFSV